LSRSAEIAPTGHTIGATYHSNYWGYDYKVVGSEGEAVIVELVDDPRWKYTQVGTAIPEWKKGKRWSHMTSLGISRDIMIENPNCEHDLKSVHSVSGRQHDGQDVTVDQLRCTKCGYEEWN